MRALAVLMRRGSDSVSPPAPADFWENLMKRKKLHEIFVATRKLLGSKKHWIKGVAHDGSDGYCLMGSLAKIAKGNPNKVVPADIEQRIVDCVMARFPDRLGFGVSNFNDDDRTKHKDVLKVLDCAIRETA